MFPEQLRHILNKILIQPQLRDLLLKLRQLILRL